MGSPIGGMQLGRAWSLFSNALAIYWVVKLLVALRRRGLRGSIKSVLNVAVAGASSIPFAAGKLQDKVNEEVAMIEKKMLGDGDANANITIPQQGKSPKEVQQIVADLKVLETGFEGGKQWGGVYHDTRADSERAALNTVQCDMLSAYNHSNALYPGTFPSVRKFEAEIIAMSVDLLHGTACGAVGLLASGGTESILIAMHAYREKAMAKGITKPNVIACVTAHPAIDKACHYFNIELIKLPADPDTQQLPPAAVGAAINANTICVYSSAPTFPHGVVDPIESLAAVADSRGVGLHVDNCLGGFWLSFMQQQGLGRKFKWDFELKGVTTISLDIHKYGCASKGASVIAFRDKDLRRAGWIPVKDGNTLYITPTLQGARSGAVMASAWGTIMHMGREGYLALAQRLHTLHSQLKEIVRNTKGIQLVADPDLSIVAIQADEEGLNIYALATLLDRRGWNTFTSSKPAAMAICIGERHDEVLKVWEEDLHDSLKELRANPDVKPEGDAGVYGTADLLPDQILDDVMKSYLDVKLTVKPKVV